MKRPLIILLVLLSSASFAQLKPLSPPPPPGPRWMMRTPGTELRIASNSFFLGVILEGGGVILLNAGQPTNPGPNTPPSGAQTVGALCVLAGPVFLILAWVHINHAGKIMDAQKVSFGPTKNGIGLAYNL